MGLRTFNFESSVQGKRPDFLNYIVTVFFVPNRVSLQLVGEHQFLVKKDTTLVGFRQSKAFKLNLSDWVVCFRLADKVVDNRNNISDSIPEF